MEKESRHKKIAVIVGAGPAGLTAALELLHRSDIRPIVVEASGAIGGISQTILHNGNHIDIGGHRFFSKIDRINQFWDDLMPRQDSPAMDELLLGAEETKGAQADPQKIDRVMLRRRRVSRIYYIRRFFDYPIALSFKMLRSLGLINIIKAAGGYLYSAVCKRPENSLEDFYINRFGRPLYSMFFEDYTQKVWGVHPSKLGADWGSQRVKGLSVFAIMKDIAEKTFKKNRQRSHIETSLIEEFAYPKFGPGQLWELAAELIEQAGGRIIRKAKVDCINIDQEHNRVESVIATRQGEKISFDCDYLISSMPLNELFAALNGADVNPEVYAAARALPYRDFMTVGLLLDKLKIKNETKLKTYADRIPDTWIYIQERGVRLGRLQIFNNWSPYMVNDFQNKIWIGLEYFCNESDEEWHMSDSEFINLAIRELESIGIIDANDVEDAVRIKMPKAYPAYYGSYSSIDNIRQYLNGIGNLYCVGRNGQHRYNNMDHSMLTSMIAVDHIVSGSGEKSEIWTVNTEDEYHEESTAQNSGR